MKIRNGFISNSSSSSFIIMAEGRFSTVRDVAEFIIKECEVHGNNLYEKEKEILNKLTPDTPVYFNSWGDDTYIHKIDDKLIVQTSQNLDLKALRELCINANQLTEEFYKQFDYKDDEYDDEYTFEDPRAFDGFYHNLNDFVNLNRGDGKLIGSHSYIYECPNCRFSKAWRLKSGKKICNCQIDKYINIIDRKEKINKINKI